MNKRFSLSKLSLRLKLVLSYLAVALGAIFILTIAVSIAVQNYFTTTQLEGLRQQAQFRAHQLIFDYVHNSIPMIRTAPDDPVLFIFVDQQGSQIVCSGSQFLKQSKCDDPTLTNAFTETLHKNQEIDGTLQMVADQNTFSSLFVCMPLNYNGQLIGAMLLTTPAIAQYFLQQANMAIFIAGLIVAVLVVILSFLFARRLTHPLEALTLAAEQMKQGSYTQRVAVPKTQDELGRLASTFNDMANTIEADVKELRHQEQARRDLTANIAHDLATPLTAIQGFSEALADEVITDAEGRQETAQRIGREVQRLRRLVKDLQQMSSLESGHAQLDLAPLDMYTLVEETLNVIQPECEQMEIVLQNEITPETQLVMADSDRITQVLLNLLDNARRHTPKGGSITIRAYSKDTMLYTQIRDTGVGIDASDLPHIFERFYRANRSRNGASGGSGLGLSIVKAIITAHGGKIWAESDPGQGTTVTFTLPLART
ncbi:MAG: HAMP domain-containing histidine kinase [Ktedonobacteraceae bacterium]|nr:HAMP domain-containing histidine kinase [Ktedonobacteraceae bacterium]